MLFSTHLTTDITTSSLLYHFPSSCLSKVPVAFPGPLSTRNVTSDKITVVMARRFQVVKQNCKVQLGKSPKLCQKTAELMQAQSI